MKYNEKVLTRKLEVTQKLYVFIIKQSGLMVYEFEQQQFSYLSLQAGSIKSTTKNVKGFCFLQTVSVNKRQVIQKRHLQIRFCDQKNWKHLQNVSL